MLTMAETSKIDLQDPKVIEEFKMIQQQTLGDIHRLRDGKKPLTEAEMRIERTQMMNKRQEERIQEAIKKQQEEQESSIKNTERIVELISKSKENLEANIDFEKEDKQSHERDKICLLVLILIWGFIMLYSNYFSSAPSGIVGSAQLDQTDEEL